MAWVCRLSNLFPYYLHELRKGFPTFSFEKFLNLFDEERSLFGLAPFDNIYVKLTPRIFADAKRGQATPETIFPRLVGVFGARRMVWGSNFPASEGPLAANLEKAKASLQWLTAEDREWIFGKTAQLLYPALAE